MRLKQITFWSIFGLLSLLVLAVAWLWAADLGVFKPQLEKWVSEKTGREFAIDGAFNVDLTRHAVVIAEDIRFQNAEWADDPQMVEIGRAEIRVDLRSLFSGPIHVELIDIDDVEIRLTQPENGDANWVLPIKSDAPNSDADDSGSGLEVFLGLIDIDRVHLVFESPERDRPLDLRLERLDQRQRDDNYLELDLAATLGDREISLKGEVGTQQALLSGKDIYFDFEGRLDTFEIDSSGWLDDLTSLRRPSLKVSARGPDIDDLTRLLGLGEDGTGTIELAASLTPLDNGPLILAVAGNIGETEIEVAGEFSDLQDLETVDIDLLASGPDLSRILRLAGIHSVREAPFMIDLDAQRQGPMLVVERGRMLFANAEFDFAARIPNLPALDDAKIGISINGPDIERFRFVLGLPGEATGAFSIDFDLDVSPNNIEVLKLDVATSLGNVRANGELSDQPDYVGSTVDFHVTSDSLGRIGSAYGIKNLPDEPFSVHGVAMLAEDGIRISGPLTANVRDISVALNGLIALTPGVRGSDLSFSVAGRDLAALTGSFGVAGGVPAEPYDVSGKLQIRNDGYRIRDLTGTLGKSILDIDALLVPVTGLQGSQITFTARGPAFEELVGGIGDLDVRPGPYDLSGKISLHSDRVDILDAKLDREAGDVSADIELGLPVSRRWANFDIRAQGRDVRSVLSGIVAYEADEAPFFVDVRGELRATNLFVDKFEVGIGDARIQASGDLHFGDEGSSTKFSFSGIIPSLARVGLFDGRRPTDQGISWSGNITGGGGVLTIDDLDLKLGQSDVNGFVQYTKGDVPSLEVNIHSESVVVEPFFEEKEIEYDAEPVFPDGKLIPDIAIPFESLKKLNATLDIDIGEFVRESLQMRNIDLLFELQNGVVDIRNFDFSARYGWLKARAKIDPADGTGKVSLELVARDFAFGLVQANADHQMTGDFDVNLESSGTNLRTLIGNLDGVLFMNTRSGRIANSRTLQLIYGDMLAEILSVINPFYKSSPYTDFACIVFPLEFVDGSVTGNPNSFIGTDKIRMTPKSVVNLKTEKIDVNIRTTPQRGLTISGGEILNPYIKIVGTLAAPRLAVDETGALISGSAAVATAGLSILAVAAWDRISRAKDPCEDIAQKGKEALGDRFPDFSGESSK